MSQKKQDAEAVEQAIWKARAEIEGLDGEDYIGNRAVFIVAQYLKGLDMQEARTVADLKPAFRQFYDRVNGLLVDECGEALSFGQAWAQLTELWPKVKYPKGALLDQARARAKGYTKPRPEIAWCEDKPIQDVVNTTYELKELRRDGHFFLSGYQAGDIMGRTQKMGRAVMQMLTTEGIYRLVERGTRRKATLYEYTGDRPEYLQERQRLNAEQFEQKRQAELQKLQEAEKRAKAKRKGQDL
jgi:hypothetical protein